jgi:hypothetical protein
MNIIVFLKQLILRLPFFAIIEFFDVQILAEKRVNSTGLFFAEVRSPQSTANMRQFAHFVLYRFRAMESTPPGSWFVAYTVEGYG